MLPITYTDAAPPPTPYCSGGVNVDALPYADRGYEEPGVREAALSLIEDEMRRFRPASKAYTEHISGVLSRLPSSQQQQKGASNDSSHPHQLVETEIMRNEFERIANRMPMEPLSIKSYETGPVEPAKPRQNDLKAWLESAQAADTQLEHQLTRCANLDLATEAECGAAAWLSNLATLETWLATAQQGLESARLAIQHTNWARKREQTEAAVRLRAQEETWVGLVEKNFEIEQACGQLESEAARLEEAVWRANEQKAVQLANEKSRQREREELKEEQAAAQTERDVTQMQTNQIEDEKQKDEETVTQTDAEQSEEHEQQQNERVEDTTEEEKLQEVDEDDVELDDDFDEN